ncbi:MAG: 1-hydroxycarotenoid 3,4-desaturase CrtD [Ferruginibacter sp.]
MKEKKAVIIGSGIAGLATAIRLACMGMKVTVFEKNSKPGGKLTGFSEQGYKFDAGPSLFTQPENIETLFSIAEEPIEDYFTYTTLSNTCKYFYENGKIINGFADRDKFAAEIEEQTGEEGQKIKKYLSRSHDLYTNIGTLFLERPVRNTLFTSYVFKALRSLRFTYLFSSLASFNKRQFKTTEVRQIFNRYATYNGSNPYKAPAMLSLIPHLEHNQGTFFPRDGMSSITNALYRLAVKKGVIFLFNQQVERIIHTESKVLGVVVDNNNIPADIVVSNADVYFTFRNLLNQPQRAAGLLKQELSSSAIVFYWGINKTYLQLELHNIFFSNDYEKEFNCLFNDKVLYDDPTLYINITSKLEPSHAPQGCENWFVMINVPPDSGQDWEAIRIKAKSLVIAKINRVLGTNVEDHIVFENHMDPLQIQEKTGSFKGAIYGASSNSRFSTFLRPSNKYSLFKGLYFCGGTVHPGGGIPLCLKSACITANLVSTDLKNYHHA